MLRQQPTFALSMLIVFCLSLTFMLLAQASADSPGAQMSPPPQDEPTPFALIKTIVVGGADKLAAATPEVVVVHAGRTSGAEAGMMLYIGDEVTTGSEATTGSNVKLTILFLDNPAEKDNEVLLDSGTHVQLGSLFTWGGKVLARVKGIFETKTKRARWSVEGTEYELVVLPDGTNTLKVLKGAVHVITGDIAPTYAQNSIEREERQDAPMFLRTAFRDHEESPPQNQMEFVAVSGRRISLERDFVFRNSCRTKHLYQIRAPLNLSWFQFDGADQFSIEARETKTIRFHINLDGTNVPVGIQEGEIIAHCVDCKAEPGCAIGGLLLPIIVKIIPTGSTRPTGLTPRPSPAGPSPQTLPSVESAVAVRMQQLTLPPLGRLRKSDASPADVDQTLNWSNEVIIPGQPTYSAQSVVPRFRTAEERNRVFREVRRSSILNDDRQSKETLADVYVDWGNGAKAEEELKRLGLSSQETPERLTTLGEAYRLMGDLRTAEQFLKRATDLESNWAPALNALGNVYLDHAKVAQDQKNKVAARGYLERAKAEYAKAIQAQQKQTPDERNHTQVRPRPVTSAGQTETVAQSNIGEVHLRLGEIAGEEGKVDEASTQYRVAETAFQNAATSDPRYQFALTGLGDVYREIGEVLKSRGDQATANRYFAQSQNHYSQAVRLHRDMSEAYVGLGRVLDDMGQHREALEHYLRASQVRPELPDPHYYLAVSLASVNPRKAAEQARAFLKIEREILKQGKKKDVAERIEQGLPIPSPTPTPFPTVTPRVTPTPGPIPTPTPTPTPGKPVKIPSMKGDRPQSALNELEKLGLKGELRDQPDCDASGRVLYTEPAKDVKVPGGTLVIVFVSSLDPNAVTVPRVSGLSRSDAEVRLGRAGLRTKIRGTTETDDRARDTVLEQRPDQGKPLMQGCEVALTLAVPVPKERVPDFIGRSRDDALRDLPRYLGALTRGSVIEVDSNRPPGTVVDQDPKPGTLVRRGSAVNLYIARYRPPDTPQVPQVVVPPLFGRTEDQAKLEISRSRGAFRLGNVSYENNAQFEYGTVMRQNPIAGRSVPYGTPIDLVIATSIREEGSSRSIQLRMKHNSAGLRFGRGNKSKCRVVSVNKAEHIPEAGLDFDFLTLPSLGAL